MYAQIHDWSNLLLAWRKARKGKRRRAPAATSVQGWVNHVRYGGTYGLRRTLFGGHPIRPPKR